ncbi:MAG: hypothetical protein HY909_08880 [Deltaproteobacteria bacterium]|nr:hypothetical protein [Deltaproteobacteria bacterium]
MRTVPLGPWMDVLWHVPALLGVLVALGLCLAVARSLYLDALPHRAQNLRYRILGWSATVGALVCALVWPGLHHVQAIRVGPDGSWKLLNSLGISLAEVHPWELRRVEAEDLGGRRLGRGRLVVRLRDGRTFRSVRVPGRQFERARALLGYTEAMVLSRPLASEIPGHVFTTHGPVLAASGP